ncbi:MAG: DUF721 domain-containing protein [Bacillota bacterium]
MKQVGSLVEKMLKNCGLWQGYQQHLLIENWEQIMGPALSEVTRAEKLDHGIIWVSVKDSVWSYHLSLMKTQLIDKLNRYAGNKMVRDIFFVIDEPDQKES